MIKVLLLGLLFASNTVHAQWKGRYTYSCVDPVQHSKVVQDTLPRREIPPVQIVGPIVVRRFSDETLIIKSCGRFKIEGSNMITAYGLNTDNPTVYGRYKIVNDSIILTYKKSIQHFNKLAPKRRVKTKRNEVYRYLLQEDGVLKENEYCFWKRKENE
ncbi:MAG: hypothetical protein NXI10_14500 [bacterium]|nr:hypothetical protein [bacterium]